MRGLTPVLIMVTPELLRLLNQTGPISRLAGFLFRSPFELELTIEDTGALTEPGKREIEFIVKNDLGFFTLVGEVTYLP